MGSNSSKRNPKNKLLGGLPNIRGMGRKNLSYCILLTLSQGALAEGWRIQPIFSANEQYTDNIYLAPDKPDPRLRFNRPHESAFVTMLNPGFYLNRTGPWSINLYYQLQAIFYPGLDSSVKINNQLGFNTQGEILDKSLFLNVSSNIGQYNNSGAYGSGVYALDNVSRTGTTSTFQTFRVNPYWTPRLGGYVEGVVGLNYTYTTGGGGSGGIGGSSNISEYINLSNGRQASLLRWRANFYQQDMYRDGGNSSNTGFNQDVSYRNYSGQIGYRLWEHVQPFVQVGMYENDFGNTGRVKGANNGSYWNIGLIWTPSPKTYLQVGAGDRNYFASLRWIPSKRTEVLFNFRDSDVGGAYGGYGSYGGVGGYGGGYGGYGGYGGVGAYGGGGIGGMAGGGIGGNFGGYGGDSGSGSNTSSLNTDGDKNTASSTAGGSQNNRGTGGGASGAGACGSGGGAGNYGSGAMGMMGGGYGGAGIGGLYGGYGGGVGGYGSGLGGYGGGLGTIGGGYGGYGAGLNGLGSSGLGVGGLGGGLNTYGGFNSGTTWNGSVCHRTRRTLWQAVYTEYTTTISQIFQDTLQSYIPIGQPTNAISINEIITRKRAQASISMLYPKTNITLTGYQERADYQSNGNQDTLGVTAYWNWHFAKQTSSQLMIAWQSLNAKPVSTPQYSSDFSMISLGVNHVWSKYVSGGLSYRYTDQSSDLVSASYSENRVMANLYLRY